PGKPPGVCLRRSAVAGAWPCPLVLLVSEPSVPYNTSAAFRNAYVVANIGYVKYLIKASHITSRAAAGGKSHANHGDQLRHRFPERGHQHTRAVRPGGGAARDADHPRRPAL